MEQALLAYLRYWTLAKASMKMGLHKSPEVVKVETRLYREYMSAIQAHRNASVN